MQPTTDVEKSRARTPVLRKVGAGAVLVIGAMIAIKIAAGIVAAAFWSVVAVVAIVAVLWALKAVFW